MPTKTTQMESKMARLFADVPTFEFSTGGDNVVEHHVMECEKVQPWKTTSPVTPVDIDQKVYIGINPFTPYMAESGNSGGWQAHIHRI